MTRRKAKPSATAGQKAALLDLRRIAEQHPDSLKIVSEAGVCHDGILRVTVSLPTGELPRVPGGLKLRDTEEVVLWIGPTFPLHPPHVHVDHYRFAGHPHVLQGERLCVYLDPSREWHPRNGIAGFLEQLWQWFADAASDAPGFDAAVALYHPVGGVIHDTSGNPTVVVRDPFPGTGKSLAHAHMKTRGPDRVDLLWDISGDEQYDIALLATSRDPLYFGAGTTLLGLIHAIDRPRRETTMASIIHQGWPRAATVLSALASTARRNPLGTPQYLVVAVPNTATGTYHLLTGRLPPPVADALRHAVSRGGPNTHLDPKKLSADIAIEWCAVSDERPEITTRRDTDRPVGAFAGKTVHILGCGGIGSWAAEYVARAGAAQITLCDPGRVGGGHLVRQNYSEADIGKNKAQALAEKTQTINDDLIVIAEPGSLPSNQESMWAADLLIDATVNTSLGYLLDAQARARSKRPVMAQLATDVRTGTLGIMVVVTPGHSTGPQTADQQAGQTVLADARLERFHCLWQDPMPGDELIPARGCSVPTFHGSAADLAAVAASLVSLLGLHLSSDASGTHLVALPHAAGQGPGHHFIPWTS